MKELALNLGNHCIETEIKRIYERLILDYFKTKDSEKGSLIKDIAFFEQLLKKIDFSSLRAKHPPLGGGCNKKVLLKWDKNKAYIVIEGQEKISLT